MDGRWRTAARVLVCTLIVAPAGCSDAGPQAPEPEPLTQRQWADLAYADSSAAQRLDLYLPETGEGPFPLVLRVHGGGWRGGSKALSPGSHYLRVRERGYALASVGYRLSSEAVFPAQIHDLKTALRWLRANASTYRLDPARVAAWGSSAGGHLVALLGTSGGIGALEGTSFGSAGESSRVQAVVDWFGPSDFLLFNAHLSAQGCAGDVNRPGSSVFQLLGAAVEDRPDLATLASPRTYVTMDDPPFLIQQGTRDCTVPRQQSETLRDELVDVLGAGAAELDLLDAGHGGAAFSAAPNVDRILNFLEGVLGG